MTAALSDVEMHSRNSVELEENCIRVFPARMREVMLGHGVGYVALACTSAPVRMRKQAAEASTVPRRRVNDLPESHPCAPTDPSASLAVGIELDQGGRFSVSSNPLTYFIPGVC